MNPPTHAQELRMIADRVSEIAGDWKARVVNRERGDAVYEAAAAVGGCVSNLRIAATKVAAAEQECGTFAVHNMSITQTGDAQ